MAQSPTHRRNTARYFDQPLLAVSVRPGRTLREAHAKAILDEAEARGWRVLDLGVSEGSLAGERTPIAVLTNYLPSALEVDPLKRLGCPVVRMGRLPNPEDDATLPASLPDVAHAARMAGDYFAQRGFRVWTLVGHENTLIIEAIDQTLRAHAAEWQCAYHLHPLTNAGAGGGGGSSPTRHPDRYDRRRHDLLRWLEALPKPVGLLTTSPSVAAMVSSMCQRGGLSMPEQVAVLSWGDSVVNCSFGAVPLSAIDFPAEAAVRAAMNLIDALLAGETAPPRALYPPQGITTRRSTDIVAVDDPTVARAVRFIWDNLDRDLSVDDVAAGVKTSRHKLTRLFREHFDRPIHAELRRVRLERFSQLLIETDQTVAQLAPQVGFKNGTYLTQAFRKTYGITPRQYRLRAREA